MSLRFLGCVEFNTLQCRRKSGPARKKRPIQDEKNEERADVVSLRLRRQRLAAECVIHCECRAYLLTVHSLAGNGLQHCGFGTPGQQSSSGSGGQTRVVEAVAAVDIDSPLISARLVWLDCPKSGNVFDDWILLAKMSPATPAADVVGSRTPDATTEVPS